jgi:hypothetical protein
MRIFLFRKLQIAMKKEDFVLFSVDLKMEGEVFFAIAFLLIHFISRHFSLSLPVHSPTSHPLQ